MFSRVEQRRIPLYQDRTEARNVQQTGGNQAETETTLKNYKFTNRVSRKQTLRHSAFEERFHSFNVL